MANIDTVLKSRDTTLPTKVHTVRALVFPVDVYRCVKKAECQRIDVLNCDAGEDS